MALLGCGDCGEAGWKRHIVERLLKIRLDDDAMAFQKHERGQKAAEGDTYFETVEAAVESLTEIGNFGAYLGVYPCYKSSV